MRLIALRSACDQCATIELGNNLFIILQSHLLSHSKFEAIKFANWYVSHDQNWQQEMINVAVTNHSKKYLRYDSKK